MDYTNWYTLRVVSGKENSIKDYMPHLEDYKKYVNEIFIPNEKTIRMRGKKKIVVNKNLLPGYIFVKLVEQTKFVVSFLSNSDGKPIQLREEEMKKIIGNVQESNKKVDVVARGEEIIVTEGPFEKFKGSVIEVDHEKEKLKVMVKVFGRDTTLDLNLNQVERV